MAELWETLTVGFVLSLLFIGVSYFFWRRYDRPTPLMVERAEEKARLREEQRTWREIEAKVRAEMAEAEEKAWLDRQRAEKAARAEAPASATMTSAWASLGMGQPVEASTSKDTSSEQDVERAAFLAERDNLNTAHRAQSGLDEDDIEGDDDLHAAPDLVQVRQDPGVTDGPEAPDWELVAKLEALANKEEVEVPDVPEAPDLDQLATTDELTSLDDHGSVGAAEGETSEVSNAAPKADAVADDTPTTIVVAEDTPAEETAAESTALGEAPDEGEAWGEDSGGDPWSGAAW